MNGRWLKIIDADELLKKGNDYMEGFQKGREFAVNQYDKILLHICDELKEIKDLIICDELKEIKDLIKNAKTNKPKNYEWRRRWMKTLMYFYCYILS